MDTSAGQRALRIGLTGGIASGKSTVARMFCELGAALIDTDEIARAVVAPGEPGLGAVHEAFGPDVIDENGALDRAALRRIVFDNAAERRRLEAILHPLIRAHAVAALREVTAPYVLVAVPLLVETGFNELVDRVLVVDCPRETQLARLMQRDSMSRETATAMLAAQASREQRLALADDVIDNSGALDATHTQVGALHARYLERARVYRTHPARAE
jgi:dephospho-CoA kinase